MLCGQMPCECRAKKPTPKRPPNRIRRVEDVALPETKADMREAMRIAANKPKPVPPEAGPSNWQRLATQSNEAEAEMEDAIRVLLAGDILHPDEQEKYRHLIPVEDRAKAWKERNNGSTT